jgi:hypothetical protein
MSKEDDEEGSDSGFETEIVVIETVVAKPELIAKEAEPSQRPSWGRS